MGRLEQGNLNDAAALADSMRRVGEPAREPTLKVRRLIRGADMAMSFCCFREAMWIFAAKRRGLL
jgi:hypothetical protein